MKILSSLKIQVHVLVIIGLCQISINKALNCESYIQSADVSDVFVEFSSGWMKHENLNSTYILTNNSKRIHYINCNGFDPVTWKIILANDYQAVRITFLSETINPPVTLRENKTVSFCYTTSLVFENSGNNIGGAFQCRGLDQNIDSTEHNWYNIYGGPKDGENEVQFLNGGENITVQTDIVEMGGYDHYLCEYGYPMALPCRTNYPTNVTVQYRQGLPGNEQSGWITANETIECYELVAPEETNSVYYPYLSMKEISNDDDAIELPDGLQIKCTIKENVNEFVLMNLLPTKNVSFSPPDSHATLYVQKGDSFTFSCSSVSEIIIQTTYPFDYTTRTANKITKDYYLKYSFEVDILIPDIPKYPNCPHYYTKGRCWKDGTTTISCIDKENKTTIHEWKLTFYIPYFEGMHRNVLRSSHTSPHYDVEDGQNATLVDRVENHLVAFCSVDYFFVIYTASVSNDPSVFFVPCQTFIECQMKSFLLYRNNTEYKVTPTFAEDLLTFPISTCKTGMIRYTGFAMEIVNFIYVKVAGDRDTFLQLHLDIFIDSFKGKNVQTTPDNIFIGTDINNTLLNGTVNVLCVTPIMIMITHPHLEFQYIDGTHKIVSKEYIMESNSTSKNGVMIFFSKVRLHSIEINGISCVNYQYASMSPAVWDQARTVQDTSNFSSILRTNSLVIKVEAAQSNNDSSHQNRNLTIGLAMSLILISVVFIVFALLAKRRMKRQKEFIKRLKETEMDYFFNGRPDLLSQDADAEENAQNSSYDQSNEINMADINIDFGTILGSGTFGIIFKAILVRDGEEINVAVKTVKSLSSADSIRSAMAELKVMLYIPPHENIVQIIGACTRNLINNELLVVMENCYNGDLLSYLQKNSKNFVNQVSRGQLKNNKSLRASSENNYEERKICTMDLINWSYQITKGMNHIASLKVIHGDLAARNVLLDGQLTVKLSDFGLAKKLYECPEYVRNKNTPLPWKWLSIEALKRCSFSTASDIWAYGITVWEIFSLGSSPYPGLEYNPHFVEMLINGFRMPLPKFATYKIYDIMLKCWEEELNDRPTFEELCQEFEKNLDEDNANDVVESPQETTGDYVGVHYAGG